MGEPLIVGAAEVPYTNRTADSVTTMALLAEAGRRALTDAAVTPGMVDGLGVASFMLSPDCSLDLAWRLGLTARWLMDSSLGGASALHLLQHARRALEAGDAETVLLLAGDRLEPSCFARLADSYNSATRDHLSHIPFGGPNSLFSLLTRRHMEATGATRSDYGRIVVAQREWAARNPHALHQTPLRLDEYLNAPMVTDTLCRFDCVPVVSGANAILVSTRPPDGAKITIRAVEALHNLDNQEGDGLTTGLVAMRERLWAKSERSPEDVDVLSIYDDYPAVVLTQLRDLGVYSNDPGSFIAREIAPRRLALNTSGGQLSCGQAGAAGGLHGLVEVVEQLRRRAGARQQPKARIGLVTGYGMVAYRYGASSIAAVLERTT